MKNILPILMLFLVFCIPIQSAFSEDSAIQRDGITAEFGLSASSISGPGKYLLKLNSPLTFTNFSFGYHFSKHLEVRTLFSAEPSGNDWLISVCGGFRAYIVSGKAFHWDAQEDLDFFFQTYFGSTWVGPGGGFTTRLGLGIRVPVNPFNGDNGTIFPKIPKEGEGLAPCLYLFSTIEYRYIDFNSYAGSGYLESAIIMAGLGACF